MKYAGPAAIAVVCALVIAVVGCVYENRQIAQYYAEWKPVRTFPDGLSTNQSEELQSLVYPIDTRIAQAEQMRTYFVLLGVIGVGGAVFLVSQWFGMVFLLSVSRRGVTVRKGKVPRPFIEKVDEVCTEAGVVGGMIWGVRERNWVRLRFTSDIPKPLQQRLRNMWTHAEWGPGLLKPR